MGDACLFALGLADWGSVLPWGNSCSVMLGMIVATRDLFFLRLLLMPCFACAAAAAVGLSAVVVGGILWACGRSCG